MCTQTEAEAENKKFHVVLCSTGLSLNTHDSVAAAAAFLRNKDIHSVTLGRTPVEITMSSTQTFHKNADTKLHSTNIPAMNGKRNCKIRCFKLKRRAKNMFRIRKFKARPDREMSFSKHELKINGTTIVPYLTCHDKSS